MENLHSYDFKKLGFVPEAIRIIDAKTFILGFGGDATRFTYSESKKLWSGTESSSNRLVTGATIAEVIEQRSKAFNSYYDRLFS